MGAVTQGLGTRRARMEGMTATGNGRSRIEFKMPSRGLVGYRDEFLTSTRGTGLLNRIFIGYDAWAGDIEQRSNGALVADRAGKVTTHAVEGLQEHRQRLFGLALEDVVEVAGVEEDALVHGRVRPAHDRGLAELLRVLGPRDGAANVRGQRAEADDVVALDRGPHLLVGEDALVSELDGQPVLLDAGAEVGEAHEHGLGVFLVVGLHARNEGLLHGEPCIGY